MKVEAQRTDELTRLGGLIEKIGTGMLTTSSSSVGPRSRPLATLKMDAEPSLWFLTSISSRKIEEIDESSVVGLSYSDGRSDFVAVAGPAQVIRDRDVIAGLWTPMAKAWFPGGVEDPDLAALRVHIHRAEYWDGPEGTLTQLYAITKAVLTGDTEALGEHSELRVRRRG
jgi:general stress protein 26